MWSMWDKGKKIFTCSTEIFASFEVSVNTEWLCCFLSLGTTKFVTWVWLLSIQQLVSLSQLKRSPGPNANRLSLKHAFWSWISELNTCLWTWRSVSLMSSNSIFMFDRGQSDLKSHKSTSLSWVFQKSGRGLFLWGSLARSSVAVRPSSSFDYISNTVSPRAALSSQNTVSQIKSNHIYSVSCFLQKQVCDRLPR